MLRAVSLSRTRFLNVPQTFHKQHYFRNHSSAAAAESVSSVFDDVNKSNENPRKYNFFQNVDYAHDGKMSLYHRYASSSLSNGFL